MREMVESVRVGFAMRGLVALCFLMILMTKSWAMNIQELKTDKGINAWLVEDHNLPLITMRFAFKKAGAAQDPVGREGTAYLVSGMLDEGAGEMTSVAFQEKLEALAIRMSFSASMDQFSGKFQTLSEHKGEAFNLLKLALTKPRFDVDALERVRKQILTGLAMAAKDPNKIGAKKWFETAFGSHPYGRPSKGTIESMSAIGAADLQHMVKTGFARDNLYVSVVGDIDKATLSKFLDQVFGDLPAKADVKAIEEIVPKTDLGTQIIDMDLPQSVIMFGKPGLKRADDDFIPAYIINYILGGGGFSSRLMEQVREKRGLAYSVYSYLHPLDHSAMIMGGVATKNGSAYQAIDLIGAEFKRLAQNGPTEEEIANAKNYLTGSYALRFDSSSKIAQQLLGMQTENLGKDYIIKRNQMIKDVTADTIKQVAKKWFQGNQLYFTIVGKPKKADRQ